MADCNYRFRDTAGAWQTITGKPAMMAALVSGRMDHLLSADAVAAMAAPSAAAPKSAQTPRTPPAPAPNTIFTEDAATKARELLRRKLGQLNSGLDPEMLQAGITLAGYHIEKGARSFSAYAQAMLADLGDAVRPYLKSWYMGVKYDPRAAGFEGMDTATTVEAADENQISKEPENAPSADSRVERDSEVAAPERAVGDAVQDEGRGAGTGDRDAGGQASRGGRSGQSDGAGVPADRAVAGGERSDQQLPAGNPADFLEDIAAGAQFRERGSDIGFDGISADPIPASQVEAVAGAGIAIVPRIAQQRAAEKLTVVSGDLENIRATLPYLLPEQQEDVLKAEQRLSKPDGYGMLFTNGTGTGKTFTGLGVVKRAVRQGKTNILIAAPNDKIAADWIESGVPLGLEISKLKDTKDAGRRVVVTTYANLGANDALAGREWDMVVADEAHKLMQAEDGTPTTYLENLRAITLHPDGAHQRYVMMNREEVDRLKALSSQIDFNNRIASADDTMDEHRAALAKENAGLEKERKALADKLNQAKEAVKAGVAERQGAARPRLVALSATPFAYMKTVDWANGYLFDYNEGRGSESREFRGYNAGSNREQFFIQHFGYSMRTNKLTDPDSTKVDVGLMQRQFNAWLKKKGSLSGRQLEVNADYDRRFVLVDSAIGNQIDEALNWLSENARSAPKDDRGFYELRDRINEKFDYLSRRYLLEAIKAAEVVPMVKAHMAMGRKVVVFHDYLQGGGFNPFSVPPMTVSADGNAEAQTRAEQFNAALRQFNARFLTLVNAPLGKMNSPITVFKRELPQVLLINGNENPKEKLKRYKVFQDDASGPQVMLVQSQQNAGWSGHDTTGKHQRVLINIGQPTAPTMAIQQEGRIYRTGQVSNAIMRYLNTGTSWEKWAFAQTIAVRASAAENLGAGELSRALKDSFISAFEESDAYPPGHEGEGTGGKERDKAQNDALTAYDRAKTFYWATQKKNSKTKAQEGADYFATPEPVGFKMVEWLGLRGGEDALEPSGGHGAIARWIPETSERTVIEPSQALRARLAMVMNPAEDRIIDGTFEELAAANKFDGIVMNPPFGTGGKTAIEHLAKAAAHLRDGGRIVALIPTGPAADKRFEKWMNGEETRDAKPVARDFSKAYPEIYRGDTVTYTDALGSHKTGVVTSRTGDRLYVRSEGATLSSSVTQFQIKSIAPTGPRSETYRPAKGLHQVAEVRLPQVTFERAATAVATRIVVIDKHRDLARAPNPRSPIDLSGISGIRELFDRLENMDLPARAMTADQKASAEQVEQPKPADQAAEAGQAQAEAQPPAAGQVAPQGPTIAANGRKVVKHVTQKGKTIHGIVAKDITKEQAQEIDPYTFKKDGGWFIREKHVKSGDAAPKFSRASTTPLPDTNIRRSAAAPSSAAGITAESLPSIFAQRFPKLAGAIKTMLDRGALGQKGGLVVLDTNDETQIAREFADRTGRTFDETVQMFESGVGPEINGFYDALSGTTFLVGPNLDGDTASAVVMHEMVHGQQRRSLDEKSLALIQGRAKLPLPLGKFLTRVAQRMEDVGESNNATEATAYIVELAVQEGRQAGFSAADGPILAWIEKNIGKPVADLVREFVAMARAWALAHGVELKAITVDDLVAYAMAGVGKAARGKVVTDGKAGPAPAFSRGVPEGTGVGRVAERLRDTAARAAGRPRPDPSDPFSTENTRLREQDKSLWQKAKSQLRRWLAPGGLLPDSVFAEKIARDSNFQAVEFDVRHIVGSFEQAVKQDFGVPFDKLTQAQQRTLSEALAGKVAGSLPAATKTAAVAMRQYIDSLSGEYLQIIQGKIDALQARAEQSGRDADKVQAINEIELYQKIRSNVGAYVHRSYQAFDDPKWFQKVPTATLNAARQYLKGGYMEGGKTSEAEALRLAEVALAEILKNGTAYDSMESFIAEGKLGAKDLSVLMRRKDVPPVIRALLGEYTDPRLNFTKSATKMGRLIWNQRFLDRVREMGMGTFLFEGKGRPPSATTQIAAQGSEVYAPLNGLWTFPEVAQSFKDALGKEQMGELYRFIVRANGLVKYGKTVLSPTTAMRNWQSAMFFALANGHFDLTQMKKSVAAFREQVRQNATDGDLAYLRHLKELGVVYDTPYAGEMMRFIEDAKADSGVDTVMRAFGASDGAIAKGLRGVKQINQVAQGFYSFGDDFWKIIGFENEKAGLLKAGLPVAEAELEAAKRIRDTYPTYSMVGAGIQKLSRFPLMGTFVSFPAEIVRTSANMLRTTAADLKSDNPALRALGMKRAVGMAMVSGLFYGLAALSKAGSDVDDDEEEALRDLAPEWQKNSTFLFAGRDEKGQLRYFDMSFLDPYGYWKRPITAMLRDQPWEKSAASAIKDMLTPFFGADIATAAIFQVLANKKDSGGKVYQEGDDALDQAGAIANHLRKALQPGFVGNIERLTLAAQGMRRGGSGQPYDLNDEMTALLGWRASTMDPKTALYYRSFEFNDAMSEAKQVLTRTLRSVNPVSPEDIRDAREVAQSRQAEAFTEMRRLVLATQAAGMNPAQIRQVLKQSSISQANAEALMRGTPPRLVLGVPAAAKAVQQARAMEGPEFAQEVAKRYRMASGM